MIDIHSHILPDLDDGARDLDESLEMIRIAAADGIRTMVATPHMLHGAFPVTVEAARDRYRQLTAAVREEGIAMEILLGGEIHLDVDILGSLRDGQALTLGEKGRTVLLELPTTSIPTGTHDVIFEMQTEGYRVVIAHPERNDELAGNLERVVKMRDRGVWMQVTARSVTGGFGLHARRVARKMAKQGLIDVLASDAHGARGRVPVLSEALQWISKKVGAEEAEALVNRNPARLLGRSA
jgi:protein-tyrosine phosphatase